MRVLHLSTSDIRGGAGRAAYRIHRALLSNGVDSWMLVKSKHGTDRRVRAARHGLSGAIANLLGRAGARVREWPLRPTAPYSLGQFRSFGVNP
jgi:hypothetical protein